jgi:hypothetical protein
MVGRMGRAALSRAVEATMVALHQETKDLLRWMGKLERENGREAGWLAGWLAGMEKKRRLFQTSITVLTTDCNFIHSVYRVGPREISLRAPNSYS